MFHRYFRRAFEPLACLRIQLQKNCFINQIKTLENPASRLVFMLCNKLNRRRLLPMSLEGIDFKTFLA